MVIYMHRRMRQWLRCDKHRDQNRQKGAKQRADGSTHTPVPISQTHCRQVNAQSGQLAAVDGPIPRDTVYFL